MRENVGTADALLRTLGGSALAYTALRQLGYRRLPPAALLALGVLLVESAVTRVCPVAHLFGLDTRGFRPLHRRRAERSPRGIDARPLTLVHTEWGAGTADLDLPYEDAAAFQRPPADS